jgi:hypothetical protein
VPPGETTLASVVPRDATGRPLGPGRQVTLELTPGRALGPVRDAGFGRYERAFWADAPRGTVATLTATVDGVALDQQPHLHVVLDRAEIGRPFAARGGCALGGGGHGGPLALLLLLALATANSRRRRAGSRFRGG